MVLSIAGLLLPVSLLPTVAPFQPPRPNGGASPTRSLRPNRTIKIKAHVEAGRAATPPLLGPVTPGSVLLSPTRAQILGLADPH